MNVVKLIGMILLGVYLVLTGLSTMSEISLGMGAMKLINLVGVGAGVLILVSIGKFTKKNGKR